MYIFTTKKNTFVKDACTFWDLKEVATPLLDIITTERPKTFSKITENVFV